MGFYGTLWDFDGILWDLDGILMGFHVILWDFMGFHRILWDFMGCTLRFHQTCFAGNSLNGVEVLIARNITDFYGPFSVASHV